MPAAAVSTESFAAPIGSRVRMLTVLGLALAVGVEALNVYFRLRVGLARSFPFWFFEALALGGILGLAAFSRIQRYELTASELQVRRLRKVNRFALAELESATVDREAMQGARKILFGNGGFGAMLGDFRSARLGDFEAFVSDPARAVVLRWPDHTVVVSPERPQEFAEVVLRRARVRV